MKKIINGIKEEYKYKKRIVRIIYAVLCSITIVCLIREIIVGDIRHVLTSILTLLLFLVPSILHRKFKIIFSSVLEIMIYILIFSSEILGEVLGFYVHINFFDTLLHVFYGFVMASIGFSLVNVLNSNKEKNFLAPKYLILFCVCYSMTACVCWEIFEYGMDKLFDQDMQKDTIITEISSVKLSDKNDTKAETIKIEMLVVNGEDYLAKYGGYIDIGLNDTMKDIIVNLIGAIIFSGFGYAYLKGRNEIANNFMIKKEIRRNSL